MVWLGFRVDATRIGTEGENWWQLPGGKGGVEANGSGILQGGPEVVSAELYGYV